MKCFSCGAKMNSSTEPHIYDRDGLRVTLLDVEVRRCPSCGEYEVIIPEIEELNRTIAEALIKKPNPLVGAEVRFLRKTLGWSATDLARYLGTTKETVSRWENDRRKVNPAADRALRLMAAHEKPVEDYSVIDAMKAIEDGPARPLKMSFEVRSGKRPWREAKAVA